MPVSDIYVRRRLELLGTLAYVADEPLVAVIGPASGAELLALANAVRRPHPLRKGSAAGSVLCFHSPVNPLRRDRVEDAQEFLAAYASAQKRQRRRVRSSTPVALVVRFVQGERRKRAPWEAEIARLQRVGPLRFGLICHMGVCPRAQLQRDLDMFVPMMSERTTLVLCGLEKVAPQALLRGLLKNGGWDGVWFQSLGLAVLGRLPFAV